MYILLSPSKSLDFSRSRQESFDALPQSHAKPIFLSQTKKLHKVLTHFSEKEIAELMRISHTLATLNYERFQNWNARFTRQKIELHDQLNFATALSVFTGDVYTGFKLDAYKSADWKYADTHIGILSGFYGLISPLTLIKPYRLEMGTSLSVGEHVNLYAFWSDSITNVIKEKMRSFPKKKRILLNLASQEYAKSVNLNELAKEGDIDVLTAEFKEKRNGKLKTIAIFAKKARGEMADMIVQGRIETKEDLRQLKPLGFVYSAQNSSQENLVFIRKSKNK